MLEGSPGEATEGLETTGSEAGNKQVLSLYLHTSHSSGRESSVIPKPQSLIISVVTEASKKCCRNCQKVRVILCGGWGHGVSDGEGGFIEE